MSNKELMTTIGVGLAAASAGMLARKTLQKSWEKVTNEPAPKDKVKAIAPEQRQICQNAKES